MDHKTIAPTTELKELCKASASKRLRFILDYIPTTRSSPQRCGQPEPFTKSLTAKMSLFTLRHPEASPPQQPNWHLEARGLR